MRLLITTSILLLALTCGGQSFTAHRTPIGGRCEAVQKKKTVGQKLRNKIRYARKRHNNEWFAIKERRRILKQRGL